MPAFVRRERKHRRLAKLQDEHGKSSLPSTSQDANRELIETDQSPAKDARRKELRAELVSQAQSKVSGKKKKRLEHYIETKLKREENAELIRLLAAQQVDTSLLQSSKTLGRATESKRDALRRALRERDAGIDVAGNQDSILFKRRATPDLSASSDDDEVDGIERIQVRHSNLDHNGRSSKAQPAVEAAVSTTLPLFGSGLKRPNDGTSGSAVTIKRRKRQRLAKRSQQELLDDQMEDDSEDSSSSAGSISDWGGFDSEEDSNESTKLKALDDTEEESEESISKEAESDDSSGSDTSMSDGTTTRAARSSAFKNWAETRRNEALDFQPSTATTVDPSVIANFRPRAASPEAVSQELQIPSSDRAQRKLKPVVVQRDPEINKAREALPVVQEEQRIMEAIRHNPVVIICGATGSGKTTQVPQMMFESGYASQCGISTAEANDERTGMIGITQPRRVAALSVAERVRIELGPEHGAKVAHQVRYDTTVSRRTALKFMTDGILLRELHQDFILSKYSAIIIDEAHDRSVNTDILIGTLSRIVTLRDKLTEEEPTKYFPLKLVIMSATLRVTDFAGNTQLFPDARPPVVEIEGRQFPVTVHFARTTYRDFEAETAKKIIKGHKKLPPGSILAFLTGQNEIHAVMKLLLQDIGQATAAPGQRARITADQMPLEAEDVDMYNTSFKGLEDEDLRGFEEEDDDADFEISTTEDSATQPRPMLNLKAQILPLYAALPSEQQLRVFATPPKDTRLIILATNVAETSLTIPGVRYVFDCGRSKEKKYDTDTGISTFEVDWISKASAAQRTGRAGRTGPGHCWRLYSSALFEEHFPEHSVPEILRTPVESIVLQLKAMDIDNVPNFPFPTPPSRAQLQAAEKLLSNIGVLRSDGRLTEQGKELMHYPLSPRFGKILLLAARNGILQHGVALVAALAAGEIFVPDAFASNAEERLENADLPGQSYGRAQALLSRWDDQSDAIKLLTAVAVHAEATSKDKTAGSRKVSQEFHLREKAMSEVQQLRVQLQSILRSKSLQSKPITSVALPLPSVAQRKMLNQVVASAFLDQVAIRADLLPNGVKPAGPKARRAVEVPYFPLFPIDSVQDARPVFVHAGSVLSRLSTEEMPSYVVYSHLSRGALKSIGDSTQLARVRMHPLTSISGKILAALAQDSSLLHLGKPIGKIEEEQGGKRRVCFVATSLRPNVDGVAAGTEWPLPAWKVEQTRAKNGEWQVVRVLSQ